MGWFHHWLDVCVDGLQGHLSGFDFVPAWLTSWHRRGMFTGTAHPEPYPASDADITDWLRRDLDAAEEVSLDGDAIVVRRAFGKSSIKQRLSRSSDGRAVSS